jgi:hypothetical protein
VQISSVFKTIIAAGIALLIISCSSNSKKKVKVQEVTLQDIKQDEKNVEPPPPPPPPPKDSFQPIMEIKGGKKADTEILPPPPPNYEKLPMETKCYTINGLKNKVIVTIRFVGNKYINGWVTSEELQSNMKGGAAFIGTFEGDKLMAKFVANDPPLVGAASEWTDKPWTLKKKGGKETLQIIFNAKNYDTNKWEDTDYQFVLVDCK